MTQEWDIKPRGQNCTRCEQTFIDRQPYFSLLAPGAEGFQRGDYCETCWPEVKRTEGAYSMWRGLYQSPPPKPEEALKKETAESLLRKLLETEDPTRRNVIFILAVMLERKKILVERDVQKKDDGTWVRVYEHRKTGETFLIPDPRLRLDELEHVQVEVITMLGGKPPERAATGAVPNEASEEGDMQASDSEEEDEDIDDVEDEDDESDDSEDDEDEDSDDEDEDDSDDEEDDDEEDEDEDFDEDEDEDDEDDEEDQ